MSFRGGRDRPRRDFPSRSEDKSHHGRSTAPPSRHLWVGNLSHTLTERALSNHFRQFGELESVAFQPGRSYAFINFINDSAAFAAIGALQGFILAGNALRIEFTKAEKSSTTSSRDEDYSQRREEPRSSVRESPFPQRDSRSRHVSSEPIYHNESPNANSKNTEPSEVLWVGFPQSLKVNEDSFWNAFSPFGEIEKISAFPGRTYAFIRYKHISSACRAKETLHGKLFGNPRVHICFARSESGTSNGGRNSMNDPIPPSPRHRPPYGRQGSSENFRHDRYHETSSMERNRRSPRFGSNLEPEGLDDAMGFDRRGNNNRLTNRNVPFEQQRFQEMGPADMYGRPRSPSRDRTGNFHDFPPQNFSSRQGPLYDDEWDLPEDALVYHGAKKLKSSIPPEPELPEYPFSESEQVKHVHPRLPEFSSQHDNMFDNNNVGHFGGYHKQKPDPPGNIHQPYGERVNSHNASYDTFQAGPVSLPQNPVEWKKLTPEPQHPPASTEWKWEGIIAKGGTSICRARCFPVGKVLDMILPEFLDCTARTSLDMLAKHYYQAASSWVVFFVPESDADMGFYNEFMNYLGEKQRAAVAKLDDKTTLFLVPPSDFSEKILKVPGKLSISGVILRLEQPSSTVEALPPPPPPPSERPDPYLMASHGEASRTSFSSPSGPYPPAQQPFPHLGKPRANASLPGLPPGPIPFHVNRNMADPIVENPQEHVFQQQGTHPQNLISGGRNMAAPPRSGGDFMIPSNDSIMPRTTTQETNSSNYRPGSPTVPQYGHQDVKPATSSSSSSFMPAGGIQQDQLAQLASFLGNSRQSGSGILTSTGEDFRQSSNTMIPDNASYIMPSSQMTSEHLLSSQYRQVHQFQQQQQQMSNVPQMMPQRDFSTSGQGNASQEEGDADPQKRLQATLELAATLLKQIQQGKT